MMKKYIMILLLCMIAACPSMAQKYDGLASFYGPQFHGRKAANGTVYNMHEYTCAHRALPFGTKLKVTNLKNNKCVVVTVTDRGPYAKRRVVDLSMAAANDLDMLRSGVVPVSVEVVGKDNEVGTFTAKAKIDKEDEEKKDDKEDGEKRWEEGFKFEDKVNTDKGFKSFTPTRDHQVS